MASALTLWQRSETGTLNVLRVLYASIEPGAMTAFIPRRLALDIVVLCWQMIPLQRWKCRLKNSAWKASRCWLSFADFWIPKVPQLGLAPEWVLSWLQKSRYITHASPSSTYSPYWCCEVAVVVIWYLNFGGWIYCLPVFELLRRGLCTVIRIWAKQEAWGRSQEGNLHSKTYP